jgi:heptosyltransferase II
MELATPTVAFMTMVSSVDSIVVVQTAFLGDVLLTLPLLKASSSIFPSARVVLVTTPAGAKAVQSADIPIEVVVFDKRGLDNSRDGLSRVAAACSVTSRTIVLVAHKSMRTARLIKHMRHAQAVVTWRDAHATRYATHRLNYPWPLHDADRSLWLLSPFCTPVPQKESLTPILLYASEDAGWLMVKRASWPGQYVVLAPGSVWPTKCWPKHYWNILSQLCLKSGLGVVVVGDASASGLITEPGIIDLTGSTTLSQAAVTIAGASCFVGNDSAPLHMASLQNVPAIGIFGPTVPEFGFGPFGSFAHVLEQHLVCRPCSPHGTVQCPLGTHDCMNTITPAEVLGVIHRAIAHTTI